ncbi:MAG: MraY family glycosyltransferase [Planctomycetota bacterium]
MTLATLAMILMAASFALSAALTALTTRLAARTGFVAHPKEDRYHQTIIPLGGGIGIFLTIAAVALAAIAAVKLAAPGGYFGWLDSSVLIHTPGFVAKINQIFIILLCIFTLFLIGLIDDKEHLGPFPKLAVQFAVATAAVIFADVRVEFFIENKLITTLLSVFWIVLIINLFNFLDNMDGASAGIAAIAAAYLFTAAALSGQVFIGAMAMLLIGTLLGFLVFNFPPAKIFMGDAGSLVVGFYVAVLTLRTNYYHQAQSGQWYTVFLPLLIMAVPLYDFISVMVVRIKQGKSPFVGDTQHFSHRLKRRGLTDTQTVLTLYLATICTGLGACFLYQVDLIGATLIFIQTFMILAIIAVLENTAQNDRTSD